MHILLNKNVMGVHWLAGARAELFTEKPLDRLDL